MATSPLPSAGSPTLPSRGQNQNRPTSGPSGYITLANWGDSQRYRASDKIRSGPHVDLLATSPLPSAGSPTLPSRGQNQKWPMWWLHHPCHLGGRECFKAGDKIRSRPQVGRLATSPLPSVGSPTLPSRGQNQKWPMWWLHHPCHLGGRECFKAGDKIRSRPQVGRLATSPLPSVGSPTLPSRGQNQKWPMWWLYHPCHLGGRECFRAGDKIRSHPQVGRLATSPLPFAGRPTLHGGGQNQK